MFCIFVFASDLYLSNPYAKFHKPLLSVANELRAHDISLHIFSPTQIYKNHGALVGLQKSYIDLAIMRQDFMQQLASSDKDLLAMGFVKLALGKDYCLVAKKNIKVLDTNKTNIFLDIITQKIKDFK